ncbi:diacylglycerol kinase [uncultured Bartonella sp.]|uniref:diacylglycerol kinase n=1 Tax=uncultured Bartonella sp. TaxID=104108 RepID=UPI0026224DB8|nr:diacylglycerol kinase [uncultured Bartonella sp.]
MKRIFNAFLNSLRALKYLLSHEKAIIQEFVFFLVSLPFAFCLAKDCASFLLLAGSIFFVILIEVINTAIEATCNAITREYNKDVKIAKDAGSLAVLLSIIIAIVIWSWMIIKTLFFA